MSNNCVRHTQTIHLLKCFPMIRVTISGSKVSHELKLEFPSVFSASCMPASTTVDHHGTRFILTSSRVGYISLSLKNKKLITWKKIEDSVIGFSSTFISFHENENYLISKRFYLYAGKINYKPPQLGCFWSFLAVLSLVLLWSTPTRPAFHTASVLYSKYTSNSVYKGENHFRI